MAETLVLMAGPLMDARIFLPQMLGLGPHHPLLLPRQGGFGSVELCAEALLEAAPARFALFGHGTGGMVAMEVLRRAPERLTRLVLAATDPLTDPPALSVQRENLVVKARSGRFDQVVEADPCVQDYAARPDCADLAQLMAGFLHAAGPEGFAAHVRVLQRRSDQQRVLRTSRLPVLLIAGGADPVHPARRLELASGLLPRAGLLVLPGVGHLLTLEAPDAVNRAVLEFMTQPLAPG